MGVGFRQETACLTVEFGSGDMEVLEGFDGFWPWLGLGSGKIEIVSYTTVKTTCENEVIFI